MAQEEISIIVDMENTIVDTSEHLVKLIQKSLNDMGKDVDKQIILKNLHEFNNFLNPLQINHKDFWENIKQFEDRIESVKKGEIYLYPDTKKFLQFASQYNLLLLTDVESSNTSPILNYLGIENYFDVIQCAKKHIMEKSEFKKPHICFVRHALKKIKYTSGRIFYVGDSESDYLTTKNMKKDGLDCTFILISRYNDAKGDYIVKDLTEAMDKIKKLLH